MNFDLYGMIIAKYAGKTNLLGILDGFEDNPNSFCSDFLTRKSILEQLKTNGVLFKIDSIEDSVIINLIDYSRAKDVNGDEFFIIDLTNVLDKMISLEIASADNLLDGVASEVRDIAKQGVEEYYNYLIKHPKFDFDLEGLQITPSAKSILDRNTLSSDYQMTGTDSSILNYDERIYKALASYDEITFANDMADSKTAEYDAMFDDYSVVFHPDYPKLSFLGCIEVLPESLNRFSDYKIFNNELEKNRIPASILSQLVGKVDTDREFKLYENEKEFYEALCKYIDFECEHIKKEKGSDIVSGKDFKEYGTLYRYLNYALFCALKDNWMFSGVYSPSLQSNNNIVKYASDCRAADRNPGAAYPSDKANMINEHNQNELDYLYEDEQKRISLVGNSNFEEAIKGEVISDIYFQAKALIMVLRSGDRRVNRIYLPISDKEFVIYKGSLTSLRDYSNYAVVKNNDGKIYELGKMITSELTFEDASYNADNKLSKDNYTIPDFCTSRTLLGMQFKLKKEFEDDVQEFTQYMSVFDIAEILDKTGSSPFNGIEFNGSEIVLTKDAYEMDEITMSGIQNDLRNQPSLSSMYVSDSAKDFYMCISDPGSTAPQLEILSKAQATSSLAAILDRTKDKSSEDLKKLIVSGVNAVYVGYGRYLENGFIKYATLIPKYIKQFVNDEIDYTELLNYLLNTAYLVYVQYIKQNSLLNRSQPARRSLTQQVSTSSSFQYASKIRGASKPIVKEDPLLKSVRPQSNENRKVTARLIFIHNDKKIANGFVVVGYTDGTYTISKYSKEEFPEAGIVKDKAINDSIKQFVRNTETPVRVFFDSVETRDAYLEYLKKH